MVAICVMKQEHDAGVLYSIPARQPNAANYLLLTGDVSQITDLTLPHLGGFGAPSKHAEDFAGEVDNWWRKRSRSTDRLLRFWGSRNQITEQCNGTPIHVQWLQQGRENHNPRPSRRHRFIAYVAVHLTCPVQHARSPPPEAKNKKAEFLNLMLRALIEHQSFSLQPVFEGMAVLSATDFVQGVGLLRDACVEVWEPFIQLVSHGLLLAL